jgi:hypothetical protein
MDCTIYGAHGGGSPMLREKLMSPDMARIMRESADHVGDVWSNLVAVRSGALRESRQVSLAVGGERFDRICADLVVGQGLPRGGYGASHEFGIGIHPGSRTPPTKWMPQAPADDLVKALAIVDSMSGGRQ